jgi:hypothetical protein
MLLALAQTMVRTSNPSLSHAAWHRKLSHVRRSHESHLTHHGCATRVTAVANAFANAVASKTITYGQAVMIACVAELFGCLALGNNVTDTIRKK